MTTYLPFSTDKTVEFAKLGGNAFTNAPDSTDLSRLVIKDIYSALGFDWKLAYCPCRGMVVCKDTITLNTWFIRRRLDWTTVPMYFIKDALISIALAVATIMAVWLSMSRSTELKLLNAIFVSNEMIGLGISEGLGEGFGEGLGISGSEGFGEGFIEGLGEGLGISGSDGFVDGFIEGLGEGFVEGFIEGLIEGFIEGLGISGSDGFVENESEDIKYKLLYDDNIKTFETTYER